MPANVIEHAADLFVNGGNTRRINLATSWLALAASPLSHVNATVSSECCTHWQRLIVVCHLMPVVYSEHANLRCVLSAINILPFRRVHTWLGQWLQFRLQIYNAQNNGCWCVSPIRLHFPWNLCPFLHLFSFLGLNHASPLTCFTPLKNTKYDLSLNLASLVWSVIFRCMVGTTTALTSMSPRAWWRNVPCLTFRGSCYDFTPTTLRCSLTNQSSSSSR